MVKNQSKPFSDIPEPLSPMQRAGQTQNQPQNIIDAIWNGLMDAISDIRRKVVEEPWFGRALDTHPTRNMPDSAHNVQTIVPKQMSMDEVMASRRGQNVEDYITSKEKTRTAEMQQYSYEMTKTTYSMRGLEEASLGDD